MNKKEVFIYDPFEDKFINRILNDLQEWPSVTYDQEKHGGSWKQVSQKMSKKCHKIIDKKFMNVSSNRWQRKGFVTLEKNIFLNIKPYGKKKKIAIFTEKEHKIF